MCQPVPLSWPPAHPPPHNPPTPATTTKVELNGRLPPPPCPQVEQNGRLNPEIHAAQYVKYTHPSTGFAELRLNGCPGLRAQLRGKLKCGWKQLNNGNLVLSVRDPSMATEELVRLQGSGGGCRVQGVGLE